MFGYVRAKRPYDQHQTYEMPGTAVEILATQPVMPEVQGWIDRHHTYRQLYKVRAVSRLRTNLEAMREQLQQRYPELGVEGVRVYFAVFQAPAYPAKAELKRLRLGVLGELRGGELRSALGKVREERGTLVIEPQWSGLVPAADVAGEAGTRYEVIVDYAAAPRPLTLLKSAAGDDGRARAKRPEGGSVVVLAVVGGVRYVVGEVGRRQW
jgi:hypothetical protein